MTAMHPGMGTMTPPAPKPPRKRRRWPWVLGITLAVITGASIASQASPGSPDLTTGASTSPQHSQAGSSSPEASQAPAVQPHATRVHFVITGQVPASVYGLVDISYGSTGDQHTVSLPGLSGRVAYSMPYQPGADSYTCQALFTGQGHVKVKIIVTGKGMAPQLASVVTATAKGTGGTAGGDAIAAAMPRDDRGLQWIDMGGAG